MCNAVRARSDETRSMENGFPEACDGSACGSNPAEKPRCNCCVAALRWFGLTRFQLKSHTSLTFGTGVIVKKIILSDSHDLFRTGIATTISMRGDYQIAAQCSTATQLLEALSAFPGCVAIVATSLETDLGALSTCLKQNRSNAIAIVEHGQSARHLHKPFLGVVSRDIAPTPLLDCIHQVALGHCWKAPKIYNSRSLQEDPVGVRDRLSLREMRVAALLLHGCTNREISIHLHTSEQVIKNCLRSMYEKSGASDRLEFALFIHHHEGLAKAVAKVAQEIHAEESSVTYSTAVA